MFVCILLSVKNFPDDRPSKPGVVYCVLYNNIRYTYYYVQDMIIINENIIRLCVWQKKKKQKKIVKVILIHTGASSVIIFRDGKRTPRCSNGGVGAVRLRFGVRLSRHTSSPSRCSLGLTRFRAKTLFFFFLQRDVFFIRLRGLPIIF